MKVSLRFQPPDRKENSSGLSTREAPLHERRLEAVPKSKAEQMVDDFSKYKGDAAKSERYKIYRYTQSGEEIEVALDFEEIVTLEIIDSSEGDIV